MRLSVATLALVTALAAFAHVARAEPGVHVDPNSPAGKEYVLPLDSARHIGGGTGTGTSHTGGGTGTSTSHSGAGASQAAPLFGSGIKRRPPSVRAPAAGTSGHGSPVKPARRPSHAKAHPATPGGSSSSGRSSAPRLHDIESAAHSTSGAQPIGLVVAAILLGGVALGVTLRRRERPGLS